MMSRPPFFPMMIDLYHKHVLVVGGGSVASRRTDTLLRCGAIVHAISPSFSPNFPQAAERISRTFSPNDISPFFSLVIAATNSRNTNHLVYSLAKTQGIPVNVCDSKQECDFFFPSLINHEYAAVSVSTAGISARLTRLLSEKLRKVWRSWVIEALSSVL